MIERKSAAFDPSYSELVDFTDTSLKLSEATFAGMAEAKSIFHETSIHVVVAPADITFQVATCPRNSS